LPLKKGRSRCTEVKTMSKVRLTLVGVKPGGVEEEVKNALAELYSKPKSDFETTCQHLFELKKPFVHIDQIDASEAELHRQQLSQIGIESEIVSIDLTIDGAQTSKTGDKKPKPKLMPDDKSVDNGGTTPVEKKSGKKALYAVTAVAVLSAFGAGYFANQLGQSEPAAKNIKSPVAAVAATPKASPEPVVMAAAVEGLEHPWF